MKFKYIILLSVIALTSCTINTTPQAPMGPHLPGVSSTGGTTTGTTVTEIEEKHYLVKFTNNEGFLSVPHGSGSKIIVQFDIEGKKSLIATLSTPNDPKANIRITQIIMPDQKSDGPFGRELKYNLTQTGQYMLIIGENKMAEGPWSGQVELKMTLK